VVTLHDDVFAAFITQDTIDEATKPVPLIQQASEL
jgi:hypothetical protein